MSSRAAHPPEVSEGRRYTCTALFKLSNVSSLPINEDHFSSLVASSEQPDFKWCVGFSIIEVRADKRFLAFVKPCFPASNTNCSFHYTLSLKDSNGRRISEYSVTSVISPAQVPSRTCHRLPFADIIAAIADNNLIMEAEVTFILAQAGSIEASCLRSAQAGTGLLSDISAMLGTNIFSDVTLSVQGSGVPVTIPAHCVLLACRSSYFHDKLSSDSTERRNREIRITDIDFDTVRHMLAYIYTDRFDHNLNTDDVLKLLKCADQFSIPGLKSLCEIHLIRNINNDIAFKCLIAGDRYNAKELKTKSLEIICNSRASMGRIKDALSDIGDDVDQEQRLRLLMEILCQISMNFLPK